MRHTKGIKINNNIWEKNKSMLINIRGTFGKYII